MENKILLETNKQTENILKAMRWGKGFAEEKIGTHCVLNALICNFQITWDEFATNLAVYGRV